MVAVEDTEDMVEEDLILWVDLADLEWVVWAVGSWVKKEIKVAKVLKRRYSLLTLFDSSLTDWCTDAQSRDKQNFTPVTVHQILTAKKVDDVYRVDDNELYTVKLIGFVSNLTFQSTNISFQLNDGSGSIDCRFFISKDDSSSSADKLK
jgi:hypothetical protein